MILIGLVARTSAAPSDREEAITYEIFGRGYPTPPAGLWAPMILHSVQPLAIGRPACSRRLFFALRCASWRARAV